MEEDGGKPMLQEMTWFPSFDPTAAPFFLLLSTVGHEPKIGTDGPKKAVQQLRQLLLLLDRTTNGKCSQRFIRQGRFIALYSAPWRDGDGGGGGHN